MAIIKNDVARGTGSYPYPNSAGEVVATRFSITLNSPPAVGDIAEIGILPLGCRIVGLTFDSDKLDTNGAPAIAANLGFLSGKPDDADAGRDISKVLMADLSVLKTGGVKVADSVDAFRTTRTSSDRSIGVKFTAAAASFQAGEIGVTVQYNTP